MSVTLSLKKKVEKLMCLKCVLGPQEPIKKFSRVIFFFTQSVRLSVTRLLWGGLKKFIKNLMCLKCVLGPQEPLKKISRVIFFFYSVGLSVTSL